MNNAGQILVGSYGSSDFQASCEPSDPANYPAGRAVRRKTDGTLSLASADGALLGVSMGPSLSDTKKTSVARAGDLVPIELAAYLIEGDLTFAMKRAVAAAIEFVDGGADGAEVVTVTGDDVAGWLISVSMDDAASTATHLKAALDAKAEALALIETTIASGNGAVAQDAFAQIDIDVADHAFPGAAVKVSNVTGKAIPPEATGSATGAIYRSDALDGLSPDTGAAVMKMAYIDMGGGL